MLLIVRVLMSEFLKKYASGSVSGGVSGSPENSPTQASASTAKFIKQQSTSLVAAVGKNGKKLKDIEIPLTDMRPSLFLRKSTVLYGTSGSGKTYLIRDIMYLLRNHFARVWVFCPTNAQNNMYTGFVPNALIFDYPSIEIIRDIYEFQKVARGIYETANKIVTLRSLFMKIPQNQKAILYERELLKLQDVAMQKMHIQYTSDVKREEMAEKIREIMTEKLRQHYKRLIGMKADKLAAMELSEEERYTLKYLYFSPDSLVIFDDAMMEVDQIIKKGKKDVNGDPVIQNFFFKGRHLFISTIYAMQSDKMFDPDLRKNTFTSIFTSSDEAMGYFGKSSNGVSLDERRDAWACIEEIFSEKNKPKHMKFVYLKDSPHKYQYVIAAPHTKFPMCGDPVRKFCERIEERSKSIDKTSKFAKKFADYAK